MSSATVTPIATPPRTDQPADPGRSTRRAVPKPDRPAAQSKAASRFSCANCEMEIVGRPTIHVGVAFCCAGCVAGGPCSCSYDEALEPEPRPSVRWQVRDCLDISAFDEQRPAALRR